MTDNLKEKNEALVKACAANDIKTIRKLFGLTPDGERPAALPDVNYLNDYPLRIAAEKGHFEVIQFLLSSKELGQHADIKSLDGYAFRVSCAYGHDRSVSLFISMMDRQDAATMEIIRNGALVAGSYGSLAVIKILAKYLDGDNCLNEVFINSCLNGHYSVFEYFVNDEKMFPDVESIHLPSASRITDDQLSTALSKRKGMSSSRNESAESSFMPSRYSRFMR